MELLGGKFPAMQTPQIHDSRITPVRAHTFVVSFCSGQQLVILQQPLLSTGVPPHGELQQRVVLLFAVLQIASSDYSNVAQSFAWVLLL